MVAPDGTAIDPRVENDFITPVPEHPDQMGKMNLLLQLIGMALPAVGVYHMHVRVEDRERNIAQDRRVRLRVSEPTPQQQPA